jgi:methyl-accepting chemotaxis protein
MNNLKIATRLGLAFGSMLALLIGVAVLGIVRMSQIDANLNLIANVNNEQARLAETMRMAVAKVAIETRDIVLTRDDTSLRSLAQQVQGERDEYDAAERQLEAMFKEDSNTLPRELELFNQARSMKAAARPLIDQVMALGLAGQTDEATRLVQGEAKAAQAAWSDKLGELVRLEEEISADAVEEAGKAYTQGRTLMMALTLVALLCGAAAAWLITRSITQPMREAVEAAQAVAAGDLTLQVNIRGRDETAQLMTAFSAMAGNLSRLVSRVRQNADSVATGSTQIAQGNNDLSSRTEEQASALEETAASMEQLGTAVRHNADNALQANQLAQGASTVAMRGGEVVGEVVQTMKGINDSSRKIAEIISVIDGIAFQTNILALNAAVEAARAGEQGRGFAVVAGEVRALAQRSAEAAKEIKGLIEASVERVEQGAVLVDEAGSTMNEIVASIRRVSDIMGEISAASKEQSAGVAQIGEAVSQMDQTTQQNAALVEESAAAAESLRVQAHQLVDAVSVFRLPGAARPTPA